jgi:hypothetical protein
MNRPPDRSGEASSGSVATDQTQDGLKVSSIESVTLSDEKAQENAHSADRYAAVRWRLVGYGGA